MPRPTPPEPLLDPGLPVTVDSRDCPQTPGLFQQAVLTRPRLWSVLFSALCPAPGHLRKFSRCVLVEWRVGRPIWGLDLEP